MATKSILKQINLSNRKLVWGFLGALENAQGKSSKEVTLTRTCTDLNDEDIIKIFGDKNNE